MKKLWFNETKCKKIHIGKESIACPELKVHESVMKKSEAESYLGDLLAADCTNKINIHRKKCKAMGIVVQIMRILKEVSLGEHYFQVALLLREALFINGILTNLEVTYGLTMQDINELEAVDRLLLKKIMGCHSKVAVPGLYLELGLHSLSQIIKFRRIMFLQYILSRPEDELIQRFFQAQINSPVRNDWINTVKEDLKELEIVWSFEEIKGASKKAFSDHVKTKLSSKTLKALLDTKDTLSKMANLNYHELKLQPYLKSPKINVRAAKEIFSFRTRMVTEIKDNFRTQFNNEVNCLLYCGQRDSQQHLLICGNAQEDFSHIEYFDLFKRDVDRILPVYKALKKALENRTEVQ